MRRGTIKLNACSNTSPSKCFSQHAEVGQDLVPDKILEKIAAGLSSHPESLLFTGGLAILCTLLGVIFSAPSLCSLVYLGFAAVGLPYRVANFTARKWTFFLIDFCYFANLACCAFFLFWPDDPRLEAAVYVLCEGPLAAALIAWQCAWFFSSPDHSISVLIHLLPGLALFCHRFLAHSRLPLQLLADLGQALLRGPGSGRAATAVTEAATGGGPLGQGNTGLYDAVVQMPVAALCLRLGTAVDVARGRVPCPAALASNGATPAPGAGAGNGFSATLGADEWRVCATGKWDEQVAASACYATARSLVPSFVAGRGMACYAVPHLPPAPCPPPAWLWLGVAPLAFYLAWQVVYFLVVQVTCRRLILSGGYDTSYRALARRAQRANNSLNRLVRQGSVARRLAIYGLLQLLFTVVTQVLAVVTYYNFVAAAAWQLVKFAVPLYLGACHQCQRLPAQQLRAAAERLVAAGMLAPELLLGSADGGKRNPGIRNQDSVVHAVADAVGTEGDVHVASAAGGGRGNGE